MKHSFKKPAQTLTNEFSDIIYKLNRKRSLSETEDGKEFVHKVFTEFPISKDIIR